MPQITPKTEIWVAYAKKKATGELKWTRLSWDKPFTASNRYGTCPAISTTPDEVVYEPGDWSHTEGTPRIDWQTNPQSDWLLVLRRYEPT